MVGPPLPQEATKAVGIPAAPLSTLKPSFSMASAKSLEVSYSRRPTSAYSHALSLSPMILFSFSSIQESAVSFDMSFSYWMVRV